MAEFREDAFAQKQAMRGYEPARSAVIAKEFFVEEGIKKVLIPGIGYGRNAEVFTHAGMQVTGIEISQTAIDIAHEKYGSDLHIYHGSVTDMPFDDVLYDGIYCYALIHLLDEDERIKVIHDCYDQLTPGGVVVFVVISKQDARFGKGRLISSDRYEIHAGAKVYYYDGISIKKEFTGCLLIEVHEIQEVQIVHGNKVTQEFWYVVCRK